MSSKILALALLAACLGAANAGREYRYVEGFDIPGNDIPSSDGKAFTKACVPSGGYKGKFGFDAFKALCDENPKCVAFTTPKTPDGCAYLKAAGKRGVIKAKDGWVVQTTQEKPNQACKSFSPNGGYCTSDPWSDPPVCCGGNRVKCNNNVCGNTLASKPREYRYVGKHDIPGNDIPSSDGKQPFTKVCVPSAGYKGKSGFEAFQMMCDENPKCVAFTAPMAPDGCAYLKAAGKRGVIKPKDGWVALTTQEPPNQQCKSFSPNGEYCTTDPWTDPPICCGGNHVVCRDNKCLNTLPGRRLSMV